jgi:hypothetical protein
MTGIRDQGRSVTVVLPKIRELGITLDVHRDFSFLSGAKRHKNY